MKKKTNIAAADSLAEFKLIADHINRLGKFFNALYINE